jgi:3-dehydroquinate synthase
MKKKTIKLGEKSYQVIIQPNSFKNILQYFNVDKFDKIVVVTDNKVYDLYYKMMKFVFSSIRQRTFFYVISQGEKSKSYSMLQKIHSFMIRKNCSRNTLLMAIGGGVVGDLAGLAASTYMRGIALIQVPTTLLAMVDSSIGGKTAINYLNIKNVVGTFYQPKLVLIDPIFLLSLSKSEYENGIGEIIKYAFLSDKFFFSKLFNNFSLLNKNDLNFTTDIINHCINIKATIVSFDEKENSLRKILNLGHTFGHGFESALSFKIKHGIAVNVGIIVALVLAKKMQLLKTELFYEILQLPMKLTIPASIQKVDLNKVIYFMKSDKKNEKRQIRFVLPIDIGKTIIDFEVAPSILRSVLSETKTLIK